MYQEFQKDNFIISTDPSKLDIDAIFSMLSNSYWAKKRPREVIERAVNFSLCYGVYCEGKQIGLARVVTDYSVFAYLCDVYIDVPYRRSGLGKWLISCIMSNPELKTIRKWTLCTRDAHKLYRKFGFTPLSFPDIYMEKINIT